MEWWFLIVVMLPSLAAAVAVLWLRQRRHRRWKLVRVAGDFTREHHMPETLPVPSEHEKRAAEGEFSFDEACAWMSGFVADWRRHPLAEQFRQALSKAEVYRQLGEKMGRGRWREVDQLGAKLADIDPLDPSAALARGRAMREMGRLTSAMRHYRKALELQPTHSVALPEFAAACRALGQPRRAIKAIEAARKALGDTHPLTIESRIQLGELVRVFADPLDPATAACIPRDQYLRNIAARIEELAPPLEAAPGMARSLLDDDLPELAELLLERCEPAYGDHWELHAIRGMLQRYRRRPKAAQKELEAALKLGDDPLIHLELAAALLDRARTAKNEGDGGDWEEQAEQHLRLAIDRDPNSLPALAMLLARPGREGLEAVKTTLEPLMLAYPRAWGPYRLLGDAYASEDHKEEALAAYEAGLSRHRADALLAPYLQVLLDAGRKTQLLNVVLSLKDLPRREPMLRWRGAEILWEAGKADAARELLKNLVADPQAPPHLRHAARDTLEKMKPEKK